jgi:hypothetical protein
VTEEADRPSPKKLRIDTQVTQVQKALRPRRSSGLRGFNSDFGFEKSEKESLPSIPLADDLERWRKDEMSDQDEHVGIVLRVLRSVDLTDEYDSELSTPYEDQ